MFVSQLNMLSWTCGFWIVYCWSFVGNFDLVLFFFASYPAFVSIIYMDGVLVSLCLILTLNLAPRTNPFILSFIKENALHFVS